MGSSPSKSTEGTSSGFSQTQSQISKSTEQDWNRVLNQWWGAWQKSTTGNPAPQTTASNLPLVTINLSTLAARHPAWKLANALEANRSSTLDFDSIRAIGISIPALSTPSFDVNFRSASQPEINAALQTDGTPLIDGYSRAEEIVIAQGIEALHSQARDQQSDSIEIFLRAVAAQQADAREQYTQIRRVAIENDVEVARNTPLPELEAPSMSPEEQLLITNLRLQLLRNVFSTEEERDRARQQLNEILNRWQARLRQQEIERLAELERRRVDLPREAREAGEAELRRDLEGVRREQRVALRVVWQEHQQRVRQDFGNDDTRLGIVLPSTTLPAQGTGGTTAPAFEIGGENSDFLETNYTLPSSQPTFLGALPATVTTIGSTQLSLSSAERSTLIRTLRTQAWREAQKQAQWAARRFGWRWQPASIKSTSAPDRTHEVLQWLAD